MKIMKSATDALKVLWEDNFFQEWRKISEIDDVLSKNHHHFSSAELGMALKRAKHLTKKGKRCSYEYIQKYPFIKNNSESRERGE